MMGHLPLLYARVAGQKGIWCGGERESTLWSRAEPADHGPAGKPVELVERALINSRRRGDLVADLCAGAGAALIACERLGRRARLMERVMPAAQT